MAEPYRPTIDGSVSATSAAPCAHEGVGPRRHLRLGGRVAVRPGAGDAMGRGRRIWQPVVGIAVLNLTCWTIPSAGDAQGTCTAPYPPVASWASQASGIFGVDPHVQGPSLLVHPTADMDGDGKDDRAGSVSRGSKSAGLRVLRGDGAMTLVDDQAAVDDRYQASIDDLEAGVTEHYDVLAPVIGDLDADGHDEILVYKLDGMSRSEVVIPGTTSPGTHDIDDVGIVLPTGSHASGDPLPGGAVSDAVLDQVGGPGEDVVVHTGSERRVVSGNDIMATGAPGTVPSLATSQTLTGFVVGIARLGQARPTLLLQGPDHRDTLFLVDGGSTTISFAPAGLAPVSGFPYASDTDLDVVDDPRGRFVVVSTSNRAQSAIDVWDIDHPCRRLVGDGDAPTTTTPPSADAPAATPIDDHPSFTG